MGEGKRITASKILGRIECKNAKYAGPRRQRRCGAGTVGNNEDLIMKCPKCGKHLVCGCGACRKRRGDLENMIIVPDDNYIDGQKCPFCGFTASCDQWSDIEYDAKCESDRNARHNIADILQSWLDFEESKWKKEGKDMPEDGHLMAPPSWPTYSNIKNWIDVLRA